MRRWGSSQPAAAPRRRPEIRVQARKGGQGRRALPGNWRGRLEMAAPVRVRLQGESFTSADVAECREVTLSGAGETRSAIALVVAAMADLGYGRDDIFAM